MAEPISEIVVPEGFEVVKNSEGKYVIQEKESQADKIAARITQLETELSGMTEPTDQELIEEGKATHIYYMLKMELDSLKGGI